MSRQAFPTWQVARVALYLRCFPCCRNGRAAFRQRDRICKRLFCAIWDTHEGSCGKSPSRYVGAARHHPVQGRSTQRALAQGQQQLQPAAVCASVPPLPGSAAQTGRVSAPHAVAGLTAVHQRSPPVSPLLLELRPALAPAPPCSWPPVLHWGQQPGVFHPASAPAPRPPPVQTPSTRWCGRRRRTRRRTWYLRPTWTATSSAECWRIAAM